MDIKTHPEMLILRPAKFAVKTFTDSLYLPCGLYYKIILMIVMIVNDACTINELHLSLSLSLCLSLS